jgi:diaminopimelate decarboxylase
MSGFHYRGRVLYADAVPVPRLAQRFGTPLYIYSARVLRENVRAIQSAFEPIPHIICYALKANSNLTVLRTLAKLGCGADIVSAGELMRAELAGIPAAKIVFAGVGKQQTEIEQALRRRILMLNVESADELQHIYRLARKLKRLAPVSLRVNPDIDPGTHPYISTGLRRHKFGVTMTAARDLYRLASRLKHVEVKGIHMHLGSQISRPAPFVEALKRVLALVDEMAAEGIAIRYLDMGGGMGIPYRNKDEELLPARLAGAVRPLLAGRDLTLILEPGRAIAGNAGILVTKVLHCKRTSDREFVVVDAGMNDLIRPSLYDAYHEIIPVRKNRHARAKVDVVGPVCETGDFLARGRHIPRPATGDLLAVLGAGAYGWSMSSNYNSRPRPAEVLVDGTRAVLAGRRETTRDLLQREII